MTIWISKVLVWGLLGAALYVLRSFFLLIFLTFVFAYIQASAVNRLAGRLPNRNLRSILVGLILLGTLTAIGGSLLPSVSEQARLFVHNYPSYLQAVDKQVVKISDRYPGIISPLLETSHNSQPESLETTSISGRFFQHLLGMGEEQQGKQNLRQTLELLGQAGAHIFAALSAFFLSLLFSFLIVLDLPRLAESVQSLRNTRLDFVYEEVAQSVYDLGRFVGRALEAQFYVAVLNTVLTAIGLWLLGLTSKMAFLSMIVFLCSFIPIAGVFISSVPICLLSLQEAGLWMAVLAVLMICGVHLIETYVLNPKIYGHHLHMNPVLVLIVLTIAGKLFGVWGLILGLPVCRYVFGQAIQRIQSADVD